jgi:hypothetical protein
MFKRKMSYMHSQKGMIMFVVMTNYHANINYDLGEVGGGEGVTQTYVTYVTQYFPSNEI